MATMTKRKLSSSTDGLGVLVVATATLGTTIHTAVTGTADFDEIYLYAYNTSSSNVKLTIEFGGAAVKDQIEKTLLAESGMRLIVPGLLLQNSMVVTAFADTTSVVGINGYVHRIIS